MVLNKPNYPSKWSTNWGNIKTEEYISYSTYILQLKHAILERITVANINVGCPELYNITQGAPTVASSVNDLLNALRRIIPCFYKLSEKDLDGNFRGFDFEAEPPFWTVEEMCAESNCDISEDIEQNSLLIDEKYKKTFIAMYNVINKLRYVPILYPSVIKKYGFGEMHDPPFDKAVNDSITYVKDNTKTEYINEIPYYASAWSGNVHWNKVDEFNGYCGYAELCVFKLMDYLDRLPNSKSCLIFVSNTNISYVESLKHGNEISDYQLKIPDDSHNIFSTGKFLKKTIFSPNQGKIFTVGDVEYGKIPENTLVPKSDFPETGEPYRRGTVTGYKSMVFFLLDYGIEDGYRFFNKTVIPY